MTLKKVVALDKPPHPVSRLRELILIGNRDAALCEPFIFGNQIQRVVNCAGAQLPSRFSVRGIRYLSFSLQDADNSIFLDDTDINIRRLMDFLDSAQTECQSTMIISVIGKNRALLVSAAYLMAKFCWPANDAISYVTQCRKCQMRPAFEEQLRRFEQRMERRQLSAKLLEEEFLLRNTHYNTTFKIEYDPTEVPMDVNHRALLFLPGQQKRGQAQSNRGRRAVSLGRKGRNDFDNSFTFDDEDPEFGRWDSINETGLPSTPILRISSIIRARQNMNTNTNNLPTSLLYVKPCYTISSLRNLNAILVQNARDLSSRQSKTNSQLANQKGKNKGKNKQQQDGSDLEMDDQQAAKMFGMKGAMPFPRPKAVALIQRDVLHCVPVGVTLPEAPPLFAGGKEVEVQIDENDLNEEIQDQDDDPNWQYNQKGAQGKKGKLNQQQKDLEKKKQLQVDKAAIMNWIGVLKLQGKKAREMIQMRRLGGNLQVSQTEQIEGQEDDGAEDEGEENQLAQEEELQNGLGLGGGLYLPNGLFASSFATKSPTNILTKKLRQKKGDEFDDVAPDGQTLPDGSVPALDDEVLWDQKKNQPNSLLSPVKSASQPILPSQQQLQQSNFGYNEDGTLRSENDASLYENANQQMLMGSAKQRAQAPLKGAQFPMSHQSSIAQLTAQQQEEQRQQYMQKYQQAQGKKQNEILEVDEDVERANSAPVSRQDKDLKQLVSGYAPLRAGYTTTYNQSYQNQQQQQQAQKPAAVTSQAAKQLQLLRSLQEQKGNIQSQRAQEQTATVTEKSLGSQLDLSQPLTPQQVALQRAGVLSPKQKRAPVLFHPSPSSQPAVQIQDVLQNGSVTSLNSESPSSSSRSVQKAYAPGPKSTSLNPSQPQSPTAQQGQPHKMPPQILSPTTSYRQSQPQLVPQQQGSRQSQLSQMVASAPKRVVISPQSGILSPAGGQQSGSNAYQQKK
ncbi:MAG: hypothetical protein EZS28_020693 [Streblomastix strix]|uniref:Dual specificity phosphatase catalytic domain-containing protein n=1 Tax=Streblomastix strix TaxID=222440 RepID=A0A5J4VMD2_9EUKA|nr:MAG: hypothetical protein EZS28_020693 [Streblomastix strix]